MKTFKIALALSMATLGMVIFTSTANASGCSTYGNTAKIQQSENINLGCGFSGQRWHTNKTAHRIFCLAVGEDNADTETAIRDHKLDTCRMAKAADRFENNEVVIDLNPNRFAENELIIGNNSDDEPVPGRFGEMEIIVGNE